MNLKQIMEVNPITLAELQHKELKKHALSVLDGVRSLIENEKYDEIEKLLFYSPAGDGYGSDNNCINFDYGVNGNEGMDIEEVVDRLQSLKKQVK